MMKDHLSAKFYHKLPANSLLIIKKMCGDIKQ